MVAKDQKFVVEKVKEMMAAPSCYAGLREVAQAWLDARGTSGEEAAAQKLTAAIEECITPIDGLVAFAHSDDAKEILRMRTSSRRRARSIAIAARASPGRRSSSIRRSWSDNYEQNTFH